MIDDFCELNHRLYVVEHGNQPLFVLQTEDIKKIMRWYNNKRQVSKVDIIYRILILGWNVYVYALVVISIFLREK